MDLDLRKVRYFLELARCLNFTEAARILYIAQPALSQQIAELEKELGVKLVNRSTRKVTLTPAGIILRDMAPLLLEQTEYVKHRIQLAEAGLTGAIRVGYLSAPYRELLIELIKRFTKSYPDVYLETRQYNSYRLALELDYDVIDIALSYEFEHRLKVDANLDSISIGFDDLVLITSEDSPIAQSGEICFEQLGGFPYIAFSPDEARGWDGVVARACAQRGIVPTVLLTSNMMENIVLQVSSGLGFSIVPSGVLEYAPPNLRIMTIEEHCLEKVAVWKKSNKNASLPLFIDTLNDIFDVEGPEA